MQEDESTYLDVAYGYAQMAEDTVREAEAEEWLEALLMDVADERGSRPVEYHKLPNGT